VLERRCGGETVMYVEQDWERVEECGVQKVCVEEERGLVLVVIIRAQRLVSVRLGCRPRR
jgi:hypothetical protein